MTDLDPTTTTSTYEPAPASARAEPVVPVLPPATPSRGSRLRWAVALVVVAVVVSASLVAAALITGRSPNATVLGYVPDQTVVYGEVRLDLPGDQRLAVAQFLSKFPGFADQAALDGKLDQVLDDLVKKASNGDQTYTTDIKPWFDGELAFSVGPLPDPKSMASDPSKVDNVHALALMAVKDPVAAQAWFDKAIKASGATTTSEAYNGTTLTLFGSSGGPGAAFALIDGKVAVAGDVTSVKAAVDTKGKGGFANAGAPKAALDSSTGDHVGFMYVALRPLLDWTNALGQATATSGSPATAGISASMLKYVPEWGAFSLRFENDAVVMEATSPHAEAALGPTEDRTSAVADHVPATALAVAISHDDGASIKGLLDAFRAEPSSKDAIGQLDKALGLVGGADAAIGWIGDTAVVVNSSDGTPEAGLVILPTDKAAADRLFTSLRNMLSLAGGGAGVTIRDETYNGSTITIVDLGDLHDLAGMAGAMGASGVSGLALPSGHIELAYAVTDKVVVFGSGPAFVKHVLDTTADNSIASTDRYKKLLDRVGAKNTGSYFVDIAAIRGLIESAATTADPSAMAKYKSDVQPYLAPFDALAGAGSVGGDLNRATLIITVK
jgi:hypothetical protein